MFTIGRCYTREEIHAQVGGSMQAYLPTRDGRVVCACPTREKNHEAPHIILVGTKTKVMENAEILYGQGGGVPVFIKKNVNPWGYAGRFPNAEQSTSQAERADVRHLTCPRSFSRAIWIERTEPPDSAPAAEDRRGFSA